MPEPTTKAARSSKLPCRAPRRSNRPTLNCMSRSAHSVPPIDPTPSRRYATISMSPTRASLALAYACGLPSPMSEMIEKADKSPRGYVRRSELRADGPRGLEKALPKISESRQQGEEEFRYMATSDAQDRL